MKSFLVLFLTTLCSYFICLTQSSSVPFITKCKHDDSKCLKEAAAKTIPLFAEGIPDLNVKMLDPLQISHIDASTGNLKFTISDITLTGLKSCEAKKISRDIDKSKIFVRVLCTCDFKGQYNMDGQLFVLPIKGHGGVHAIIRKVLINVEADINKFKDKEDINHWAVTSWKHNFSLKDKSDVKFENLFPDNEFLRNATNELIASNGNDVISEIGPPVIKAIVDNVVNAIHNFFKAVPLEDLVLE